jgi:hypothetical protein
MKTPEVKRIKKTIVFKVHSSRKQLVTQMTACIKAVEEDDTKTVQDILYMSIQE